MAAPSISVRLSSGVYNAMVKLAKLEHKTITDVGRELIERGLSSHFDRLQDEERQAPLEQQLKKMEDHLAALMARTALDVSIVYNVLWHQSDKKNKTEMFNACITQGISRLKKKLTDVDADVKDIAKIEIHS